MYYVERIHYRILLAMSKTCVPALPNSVGNSLLIIRSFKWVPVLLKLTRITYPEFLSELFIIFKDLCITVRRKHNDKDPCQQI